MKLFIIGLSIFFSLAAAGQNPNAKSDSIKQAEINKVVTEIVTKTPIAAFQEFLYKNMTAEAYGIFIQYYNAFIDQKYKEATEKKPK